ncbi:hypothetical protein [Micromonospora profundi]|uniref:hypothetical protein n=1 Tax=Micromonospora TaxID=1873 RepID=UPI00339FE130
MGDGLVDDFNSYIEDAPVSAALREWAAGLGATVRPPCQPSRRRGHSGAELIPVIVARRDGRDAEHLYVKVLPTGQAAEETARHMEAVDVDAGFAERHLVRQPYPRHPVGDGRYLMFQDIARGAEQVLPLCEVRDDQRKDAYRTLLDGVWNGWYRKGRRISRTTVGEFVRRELTDARAQDEVNAFATSLGLGDTGADWLHDAATGAVLPNPLRFAEAGSIWHDGRLDQLCGASHGDLQGRNALYPLSRPGLVDVKKFCLVDLDRFAVDAPLTRDLTTLLLDAVLPELADHLGAIPADALRTLLITPTLRASGRLPALSVKVIKASYAVGLAVAKDGNWGMTWRGQYLLSLVSQALICCTYEDAGPAGRVWYFRLAAYAAQAYQQEFQSDIVPPTSASLPLVPFAGVDPQPTFPGNDRSARFDAVGPQPSQQNRGARLDWTHPDQTRRQPDPEAPMRPWWAVEMPQRQPSGGWHGTPQLGAAPPVARRGDEESPLGFLGGTAATGNASAGNRPAAGTGNAPTGNRPGTATGNAAGVTRAGVPGRPTTRNGERHANRPAPRHAVSAQTNGIPRPRRPFDQDVTATPAAVVRRLPPKLRTVLAILLGSGVSLAPLVVSATTVRGRGEARVTPTSESPPGNLPSPGSTSAYAGRAGRLADLAGFVGGIAPTAADGSYTVCCLRGWAPADLAPGINHDSYRDEQLWWDSALSGRRIVTPTIDGRRSRAPAPVTYRRGDLSEIPPVPSVDPPELRRQLTALVGELPPELRNAAGLLKVVSRIFRYHLLSPGQISALLFELAATPGIQDRGAYPDWNGRTGLAFSADDAQGRRETVQFDPRNGELLSHETTTVADNQILEYVLFLNKARTDRTTGPGCA